MRLRSNPDRILVLPDLQAPFHHRDAIPFLADLGESIGYTKVVSIGDEVDQHALSRFAHDPDGMAAGQEHREANRFMQSLYEWFPEACACFSNHTDRIFRKAFEAGIPRAYLRSIREFMGAPATWEWRREWRLHDIIFTHGDSASGVQPHRLLAQSNLCSTVIGHHHSTPGVAYLSNADEVIFGMNVGCLVNSEAYAFHYTKYNRYKPVLGAGVVLNGIPHFVPMITTKSGRWDARNQVFPRAY